MVVFEEPGVKIRNKTCGKGLSKQTLAKRELQLNKKVEKVYKKERSQGDALPAVLKVLELSTTLR